MFGLFGNYSPLENYVRTHVPPPLPKSAFKLKEEEYKDANLRDAIIYLERKCEDMEEWRLMANVAGLTETERKGKDSIRVAQIAPFRRAIEELKKVK